MRKFVAGLVAVALAVAPARASAAATRDSALLRELQEQLNKEIAAGRFAEATRAAERIERVWKEAQGAKYWKTIDARYEAERWRRLSKLSEKDRGQIVKALGDATRG